MIFCILSMASVACLDFSGSPINSSNETVEKPYFQMECKTDGGTLDRLFALNAAEQDGAGSDQRPKGVDLADIVYQSE